MGMKTFSPRLQESIAPSTAITHLRLCAKVRGNGPLSAVQFFWDPFAPQHQNRKKKCGSNRPEFNFSTSDALRMSRHERCLHGHLLCLLRGAGDYTFSD